MVGALARRLQVVYARNRGISAGRACALLSVSRSTLGYCSRMVAKDAPVRAAMQEPSGQYPRFGYRRIQVFLKRRGLPMSADRAYRIWSAEGLPVPKKRPRPRTGSGLTTSCLTLVPMGSS
jgi:putative transposase